MDAVTLKRNKKETTKALYRSASDIFDDGCLEIGALREGLENCILLAGYEDAPEITCNKDLVQYALDAVGTLAEAYGDLIGEGLF